MIYSCSLEFDRALTAEQQANALREAGFTHCFLTWGLAGEGIGKVAAAHKAGLTVETIHASYPGCNEMWLEGEVGEARLQYFLDCVRGTAMIGAKTMILHVSSGHQPPEMCELAVQRFQKVCDEGERLGVNIAFENLTNIHYLHYIMERVHSPAKKYCYDCGHENLYYKNDGVLERYSPLLVAIHLHDNAGDHDTHLLPFTASIDFDRVAKRLAAVRFPENPYAIWYAPDPALSDCNLVGTASNEPDHADISPCTTPGASACLTPDHVGNPSALASHTPDHVGNLSTLASHTPDHVGNPGSLAFCAPDHIGASACAPAGDEFPIPITLELKANGSDPDLARRAFAAATRIGELVKKYRNETLTK